jgi:hypothetical protein
MFNISKRDPAQEKLKIPNELFGATVAAAGNACNIPNGAGLKGKFSREAIFAEVCGYYVKTVIVATSRAEMQVDMEEGFNPGARFLPENAPRVLSRLRDPKVSQGLRSQGFFAEDLGYMERPVGLGKPLGRLVLEGGTHSYISDCSDLGRKYSSRSWKCASTLACSHAAASASSSCGVSFSCAARTRLSRGAWAAVNLVRGRAYAHRAVVLRLVLVDLAFVGVRHLILAQPAPSLDFHGRLFA